MIVVSAILMALSQHPLGYGFLSFFSIIPIIPTLQSLKSYKKAIKYGFIWGFTYNLLTVYWIALNIGTTPAIAFLTMLASVAILLVGPVMIFLVWCMLNKRGVNLLFLSFVWASVELVRSYGTLGFPWTSISNSLLEYNNIIQIVVDRADVILDFDLFGNNVVLAEIDIAKYFSKPLRLDGPKSFDNQIDYTLPTGEKKKMSVTTKSYELILVEDAIQLITTLDFNTIELKDDTN